MTTPRRLTDLTATTTLDNDDLIFAERIDEGSRKITVANLRAVMAEFGYAHYYMQGNATPTSTSVAGTYYKAEGTTSAGPVAPQGFTLAANRATYTAAETFVFEVRATASVTDGNNQQIAMRVAKNGTPIAASTTSATTSSGGRVEALSGATLVSLAQNDYIEVWVANLTTGGGSTTVEDLNVIITRV